MLQLAQQFGQPRLAVQVEAVVGGVLGHDHQLAHAVGGQLAGLGHHFLHRLRVMFAAHFGNCAERTQPVAAFGDFQKREVPRRDPHAGCVGQRMRRGGVEDRPLFFESAQEPVGHLGDLLATEDADQVVDLRARIEQRLVLPLGEAARDDHAAKFAAAFEVEHLVDGGERFLPGRLDEPARVDDGEVGAARIVDQLVAVELQQAEHPLAVDQVLGAAKADECVAALRSAARELIGESV